MKQKDGILYLIICFTFSLILLLIGIGVNSYLWFTVYMPVVAILRWKWDNLKILINNWSKNARI